jgi:hypothetical protein
VRDPVLGARHGDVVRREYELLRVEHEAVEALTEAGGVKVSTYRRMDTFKPRDDGDTEGLES